jgi:glycosyltransferase involved in cell wall biosynthesis/MoaA/NifB/PqqE/SkfB family radical SAM enzyme
MGVSGNAIRKNRHCSTLRDLDVLEEVDMRILQVVHGYPPRYNAGSEVYTQTLSRSLVKNHQVMVFSRFEDPFLPLYAERHEHDLASDGTQQISLRLVNLANSRDRYRHAEVDEYFGRCLSEFRPDVVHVQHLNHLSTSLVMVAAKAGLPILFTLHDFWLMCPRGQFIQFFAPGQRNVLPLCDGQENGKCAERCYSRYFSGAPDEERHDVSYYADWVGRRMHHVREVCERVDMFIAPSLHLQKRFVGVFGLPAERVTYLDYGFDLTRLANRCRVRTPNLDFVFGYIGTHVPSKGIDQLLQAFARMNHPRARLRIWGRPNGESTPALRSLCDSFPSLIRERISWEGEYANEEIVPTVFNNVDAIVVPSLWLENSPLVIHEAQQARVPVITADVGGMAEYVKHEVNGLLFRHRDPAALAIQMARLADDPALVARLGSRGYLHDEHGNVPSVEAHTVIIEGLYREVLRSKHEKREEAPALNPGPWRITFDTNPDDCNLKCVMCEEHSPYSQRQTERIACGKRPRRMDISVLEGVLEELKCSPPRELIPSTMGEPLLYRDFDRIVELCRHYGIRLNLTTNGTFPRRGVREWASLILPVGSDVKISFNGVEAATQEHIMQNTRLETVLENVRTFVALRDELATQGGNYCSITLQVTFLEENLNELPQIVRLAARLNVDRVKGHQLWVHFKEMQDQDLRRSPESVERWNQAVVECEAVASEHFRPNGQRVKLEHFTKLEFRKGHSVDPDSECPFLGKEAWINHAGRFDPCCAPNEQRKSLGSFGKVQERGFVHIWNSPEYRDLLAGYRDRRLCQTCPMRKLAERKLP